MLADGGAPEPQSTGLQPNVFIASSQRLALIGLIAAQLPVWRDRSDRPSETAETVLTSHLSRHLNSFARMSPVWNFIQFSVEDRDDGNRARHIDLGAAPSGVTVWIEGRSYSDFQTILPIECKRLPTPVSTDRDEREYLHSRTSSTGGIQRFKAGHHGSLDQFAAMIAYVQAETIPQWRDRIGEWVAALVSDGTPLWSESDRLDLVEHRSDVHLATLQSRHSRAKGLAEIELRHLWIEMN